MTMSPDMRAGDSDRDRTVGQIREAFAEGRLTNDEFQQRMAQAQQALTFGQLAELTADLPTTPMPVPSPARASTPATVNGEEKNWRKAWASWLGVSLLVNVIWGVSWLSHPSDVPYYWPIWVMAPWGIAMLIGWLSQRGNQG